MKKVKIGNVEIEQTAILAPMASVSDRAYRYICKKYGAPYMVSEMASSKGMHYNDRKTRELLSIDDFERPMGVQIFGDNPEYMSEAAKKCMEFSPNIIDINMGCPVPKVAGNGAGSSLMKTPELAGEIVKAVVSSVDIPVTVKIRKGWDDENVNAVEFSKILEANGASAICIHGRTRKQMYKPPVDWDIIKRVKQAISIPVIGSGDVISPEDVVKMYKETGCDLVMIGRGSYGNPWIFSQVKEYMERGEIKTMPTVEERLAVMVEHIKLLCEFKGENIGMKQARKHSSWYIKGMKNSASFRGECGKLEKLDDINILKDKILEYNK
ncbi:MAG: tRNA dihydrouridine synthase DusB [Oscillospiraceae bacterium]|nr:tRNA dihydrouridine synthase DusB [Oscillospiraceae bacterium]